MNKKLREIENGSMALNMEDVIALGKQMERMRDGKALQEDGRTADPIQHTEEDFNQDSQ